MSLPYNGSITNKDMNFSRNPNTNSITLTFDSGRVSDLKNALDFAIDNDNSLGISDVIDLTCMSDLLEEALA
jgi:hypothetical protein|tara:strand:- start:223 stop:438 length:216 start_codon:yes stop_codon:yes gene_type:complete